LPTQDATSAFSAVPPVADSSAPRSRSTKAPLLYPKEPESSAVRTPLKIARVNALEMTTFFFYRANNSQTKIAPIQTKNLNLSAFTTTTRPVSAGGASARIAVLDSGKMHQSAHHTAGLCSNVPLQRSR